MLIDVTDNILKKYYYVKTVKMENMSRLVKFIKIYFHPAFEEDFFFIYVHLEN